MMSAEVILSRRRRREKTNEAHASNMTTMTCRRDKPRQTGGNSG